MKLGSKLKFSIDPSKFVEEKIQKLQEVIVQAEIKATEPKLEKKPDLKSKSTSKKDKKPKKIIEYKKKLPLKVKKDIKRLRKRIKKEKLRNLSKIVLIYNSKTKETKKYFRKYKLNKLETIKSFWKLKLFLHKIAPEVFTLSGKRPTLAIGIDLQIIEALKNITFTKNFSKKTKRRKLKFIKSISRLKLKSFLKWYTRSRLYYKNHKKGSFRYNLDSSVFGEISEKHIKGKLKKVKLIKKLKKFKLFNCLGKRKNKLDIKNYVVHKNQPEKKVKEKKIPTDIKSTNIENITSLEIENLTLIENKETQQIKPKALNKPKKSNIIRELEIEQMELKF